MILRATGYRFDPPDARDRRYLRAGVVPVAPAFDLRAELPGPLDQGQLGSCAAHASAKLLWNGMLRATGAPPSDLPSRLGLYFPARAIDGSIDADTGTTLRAIFRAAQVLGFCPEKLWPYDIARFRDWPPTTAFEAAFDETTVGGGRCVYHRLSDDPGERLSDIDHALASGFPVAFGTEVTEAFVEAPAEVVLAPQIGEPLAGGHAMVIAGKRQDGLYLVGSSWGEDWGMGGYCWFHPDYLAAAISRDFWVTPTVAPWRA